MKQIKFVDLKNQYLKLEESIDKSIKDVLTSTQFIKGGAVAEFEDKLSKYLDVKHTIACANGTDALQIALMALGLQPGDEVIVPAFTYVATAEVIALLQLKPIMVDVDERTFNIDIEQLTSSIGPKTKAIVPVHLYGQSAEMEQVNEIAQKNNLFVIEDNAQAIGADYSLSNGTNQKAGTIGDIGCTSFFPSKNLGCYGDGGAIFTNNDALAEKIRMIANHGQRRKYYHEVVGINSRLDTIQAAILNIKLDQLDTYIKARQEAAYYYDKVLGNIIGLEIPYRDKKSTHVFHQYTLIIKNGLRNQLQEYLKNKGIPTMIYYPFPLYQQPAFMPYFEKDRKLPITEQLCQSVLSLPMHTEMTEDVLEYITKNIIDFFEHG